MAGKGYSATSLPGLRRFPRYLLPEELEPMERAATGISVACTMLITLAVGNAESGAAEDSFFHDARRALSAPHFGALEKLPISLELKDVPVKDVCQAVNAIFRKNHLEITLAADDSLANESMNIKTQKL
jgi:hypothetical protein